MPHPVPPPSGPLSQLGGNRCPMRSRERARPKTGGRIAGCAEGFPKTYKPSKPSQAVPQDCGRNTGGRPLPPDASAPYSRRPALCPSRVAIRCPMRSRERARPKTGAASQGMRKAFQKHTGRQSHLRLCRRIAEGTPEAALCLLMPPLPAPAVRRALSARAGIAGNPQEPRT